MEEKDKQILEKIASTIRGLSMDAVQKANSGHPGLPLGCAEFAAYLWGEQLRYNPKNPDWAGRDHFVLSAGHGCMLQYAILHLSGYALSLDQIKHFRQLHSQTPGHPELGDTAGIEVTTGPLGQGVANGAGMALGLKILQRKFGGDLFDSKVFVLAGDGCIMEGISAEASSLAGHLHLNNLVLVYDYNQICLDGPISECLSEDTKMRYRGYGWDVFEVDGYDLDQLDEVFASLRQQQDKPALVVMHTTIGKGSPNKAGTHKVHGAPLGEEEVALTKKELGLPDEEFFIPQAVINFFEDKQKECAKLEDDWNGRRKEWAEKNPELSAEYDAMHARELPKDLERELKELPIKSPIAGRKASQEVINLLSHRLPYLYGGSADLSGSDLTMMKEYPIIAPGVFTGRNIKFGVREFAMAAMATGLARTDFFLPFVGTFLTFSDYMRNAIRLASLAKIHVIYQFTHDSIFLGEDGPTHQPVEHYMSLRAIPNLHFIRPGDANEVKMAWLAALQYQGPTAIVLTRQGLPELPGTNKSFHDGMGRGAYLLRKEKSGPDYTLFATGSELHLANDVAIELEKRGKGVRVVSMPCWELFEQQDAAYQESIVGGDLGKRVSIEAGVDQGWYKYIGREGVAICMESFGLSAPASELAKEFGFTVEDVLDRILT